MPGEDALLFHSTLPLWVCGQNTVASKSCFGHARPSTVFTACPTLEKRYCYFDGISSNHSQSIVSGSARPRMRRRCPDKLLSRTAEREDNADLRSLPTENLFQQSTSSSEPHGTVFDKLAFSF